MSHLAVRVRVRPSRHRHPCRPLSPTTRPSLALPSTLPPPRGYVKPILYHGPTVSGNAAAAAKRKGVFTAGDQTMATTKTQ
jgi:hypothetical protein